MSVATAIRPQAGPPLSGAEILQNACALATRVREKNLAAEYDRLCRLPDDIVAEIRAAGIMRMNMPKIWGGPDHLMRKMSGVPLGVAADALETARDLLSDKTDRWTGVRSRDIPRVQSASAQAHGMLAAARSYVFTSLEAQWKKLEQGKPLTVEDRADSRLSRTNAFRTGRDMVALLYDTIGASAIYSEKSPFDRHLRDLRTACQHLVGQTKGLEGIGPMLLGGEPAFPFI